MILVDDTEKTKEVSKEKKNMIKEIMYQCHINDVKKQDDIFLSLAFMDEVSLKKMCQELHIS